MILCSKFYKFTCVHVCIAVKCLRLSFACIKNTKEIKYFVK